MIFDLIEHNVDIIEKEEEISSRDLLLFLGRFKMELTYAENHKNVETTKTGIFEYIEMFYNRKRRHSTINNMSPFEYEQQYQHLTASTSRG